MKIRISISLIILLALTLCFTLLRTVTIAAKEPSDLSKSRLQETEALACPPVQNTPTFTIVYGEIYLDGAALPVGGIVEAVTPRGDVAGCFQATTAGSYGTMYVYGEDTSVSPTIPGFRSGEIIILRANGTQVMAMHALGWSNDRAMHRLDLTNLNIAQSGNDAVLSWRAYVTGMNRYEVWRAIDAPYFNPGDAGSTKIQTIYPPGSPGSMSYTDVGAVGNTTSNYYYVVRGVGNDAKVSDTNRVAEIALPFSQGWNLISLPLQTDITYTAQSFLNNLNASTPYCVEADRFTAGDWDGHLNNLPFNDFELALSQGYYIRCDTAGSWTTLGDVLVKTIPIDLSAGLNLVGIPYPASTYSAQSLLDSINAQGGACTEVHRWSGGSWETHLNGSPSNNFTIAPTSGYFIKCSGSSTFTPGS